MTTPGYNPGAAEDPTTNPDIVPAPPAPPKGYAEAPVPDYNPGAAEAPEPEVAAPADSSVPADPAPA